MGLNIEIEGVDQMRKNFDKRGKSIEPSLNNIIQKSIFTIEREEKIQAPVDTGRLRSSITEGREFRNLYGSIGPTVTYAKFVNYGTRFQKANPFIDRAIDSAIPEIRKITKDEIDNALNV